ncbi:zeta toxin family protein [Rhodococcus fascians]|nr:zeta toxin family protein [Rhodococcus fascians]
MRRLDLVVGPNGAGKTTFVEQRLFPLLPMSTFVNADVIAKQNWPDAPESHSYEAARTAARIRDSLVKLGESFIAETVFSHPSKLDFVAVAKQAGYVVVLHVITVPVELSIARVAVRVEEGGHHVPEDRIRERHTRLWSLVSQAIDLADQSTVYDNSRSDVTTIVARYVDGDVVGDTHWPAWAPNELVDRP